MLVILSVIPSTGFTQSSSNVSDVSGEPDINITLDNKTVKPGEKNTIRIEIDNKMSIQNGGPDSFERNVSTAENLSVDVSTEEDIEVISSDLSKKKIDPGESINLETVLWVPESASDQDIMIDLTYDHTSNINYNNTNNNVIVSSTDQKSKSKEFNLEMEEIPRFDINTNTNSVPIGEVGITELTVTNIGDVNVNNAELELQSGDSDVTFDGRQNKNIDLGDLDESDEKEFNLRVRYRESASNKDYSISGVVTYDNKYGVENTKDVDSIIFNPEDDTEISVEDIDVNASVGGSGELEIVLENSGEKDIYDSRIELNSNSGTVFLGGKSRTNSISIGSWDENDDRTISVPISFSDDATISDYSLSAVVRYNSENNIENQESVSDISVTPLQEQKIDASIVGSKIAEGENGNISFEIDNEGPKDAENIKLKLSGDENLVFLNKQNNIGILNDGESEIVDIPVESPTGIDSSTQNVDVTVSYSVVGSDTNYVDKNIFSVDVEEKSQQFEVDISDNVVEKGSSKSMDITIKNNQTKPISDIEAEFSSTDPLSLDQESAYLDELSSSESGDINISVSASSGSISNTYPIKIDFEYKNSDSESKLSDVYTVPVEVKEPADNDNSPIFVPALIVLIIIALTTVIIYKKTDIINKIN